MMDDIPSGFERHFRKSPVTDPWEPLYSRREGSHFLLGLRIATPHCNARGILHGGVISALADDALGLSCVVESEGMSALTVHLSTEFLSVGQIGQWLEFRAELIKVGRSIAFARATVSADANVIADATEIFKMIKRG